MFVVYDSLLFVRGWVFVVCCSILAVRCLLLVVGGWSLFVVCSELFVVRGLLLIVLFVVLFVVRGSLLFFVICWLLFIEAPVC